MAVSTSVLDASANYMKTNGNKIIICSQLPSTRAQADTYKLAEATVATEVIVDYATRGAKPPDYIWRGHRHTLDDSGFRIPGTRAIASSMMSLTVCDTLSP